MTHGAAKDIVERLRKQAGWHIDNQKMVTGPLLDEAADEIDRLRAALLELVSDCEEYARINNLHNSDGSPATNHAMRRARAALEGK
jgi:hypothetical protein